jgi:hypothetical protein
MNYYDYRESFFDRHFGKIMIAFFVTVMTLFVLVIQDHNKITQKHYQQCLDDGKKEYECYALVHNGGRR